ncbi:MAG: hypothetical protein ACP5IT_12130, partial [Thermoproteota archaeon]
KWLIIFSLIYMLVSSVDIITTYSLVRGAGFAEVNPYVRMLLYEPLSHCFAETFVFGLLLLDVMIVSFAFKVTKRTDYSPLLVLVASLVRLVAVINNLPLFITLLKTIM